MQKDIEGYEERKSTKSVERSMKKEKKSTKSIERRGETTFSH